MRERLRPFWSIQFVAWMVAFSAAWAAATAVAIVLDVPPHLTVLLGIVTAWVLEHFLDILTDAYAAERGGETA